MNAEREVALFEAWYAAVFPSASLRLLERDRHGEYKMSATRRDWLTWQSRAALEVPRA